MLTRRAFNGAALSTLVSATAVSGQIKDQESGDVIPPLPSEFRQLAADPPRDAESLSDDQPTGFGEASTRERAVAKTIIDLSPSATVPFKVASYFHSIATGQLGTEKQGYMRAWPIRAPANPLLRAFFEQTHTRPSGDVTAWCAAFLNWCMVRAYTGRPDRARLFNPPNSASSGAFRSWGKKISLSESHAWSQPPQPGDIVVFAKALATGHLHPTQGHVGFFVRQEGGRIFVLGGNQFEGRPPIHCINIKPLRILTALEGSAKKQDMQRNGRQGTVLAIHSIRTARSLHEERLA